MVARHRQRHWNMGKKLSRVSSTCATRGTDSSMGLARTSMVQMSTTTADRTVDVLRRIFPWNGLPDQLVTDNRQQLVSETFQDYMRYNEICHVTSMPYHPRRNGLAERLVHTLEQSVGTLEVEKSSITKRVSNFLLAYRSSSHCTTGEKPAKLFIER